MPTHLAEVVVTSATRLFLLYRDEDLIKSSLTDLIALGEKRNDENLNFGIGEGIVRVVFGQEMSSGKSVLDEDASSDEVIDHLIRTWTTGIGSDTKISEIEVGDTEAYVRQALEQGTSLCRHVRPSARAAGCIYVFTILRYVETLGAKHNPDGLPENQQNPSSLAKRFSGAIQPNLRGCQGAFSLLLSEKNDFTQQLAARGLTSVYNLSNEKLREEMVSDLVRSLTSSKSKLTASRVAGDEGGLLELEGSGSEGASSYKEICQLCNDMGKPELIYRFLDIAGHAAVWNNRRGAALVGETIFKSDLAAEQLKPHFSSLLPKLYMYSYDPAPGVRMSMGGILTSLTSAVGYSSVSSALEDNIDTTFAFLLESMGSRQWRMREAAAMALRDLLPSRKFESVEPHLERVWYMVFRSMDDIKESVRVAGQGCARAVSSLSARLCDPRLTGKSEAEKAALLVVPVCLKGYTSGVKETQQISVSLLTTIIKSGGDNLRPLIPDTVQCLLSAASELEPQILSYAQFHVEAPEDLESSRVDAAASSQGLVTSSLDRLMHLIDSKVAAELAPVLVSMTRSGVGIPTRVATAQFIASLFTLNRFDMANEYSKLLDVTLGTVFSERTGALIKCWAAAALSCASAAPPARQSKMMTTVAYRAQSEDESDRKAAAIFCSVLSARRPEMLKAHAAQVLPVACVSRFVDSETSKDTNEAWRLVWEDNIASSTVATRHYSTEILGVCEGWLLARFYALRKAAAKCLAECAIVWAKSEDTAERSAALQTVKKLLVTSLEGGSWDGKDIVAESLAKLTDRREFDLVNTAKLLDGDQRVIQVLCSELQRGSPKFRMSIIQSLKKILKCQSDREVSRAPIVELSKTTLNRAVQDADQRDVTDRLLVELLRCLEVCLGTSEEKDTFDVCAQIVQTVQRRSGRAENALLCLHDVLPRFQHCVQEPLSRDVLCEILADAIGSPVDEDRAAGWKICENILVQQDWLPVLQHFQVSVEGLREKLADNTRSKILALGR